MDDKKPTTIEKEPQPMIDELITDAQDAAAEENNQGILHALKLSPKAVFWSVLVSTAIIMEGYDTMLMGNMYAHPAFQARYGIPAKGGKFEIPAAWQAGLSNGAACGQLIGLLIAGYVSERFGFRKTMIAGLATTIGIIFILFFAPSLAVLLVGQVLFGIPLGLFQTTPVIYAMEIAPAALRPYLTTYVNLCWSIGHLLGAGILRGSLSLSGEVAYRVPFGIQWFWPVVLIPALFFAPESPWWLVRQGKLDEAKTVLGQLLSHVPENFSIDKQVALMVVTTEHEREVNAQTSYWACFHGTDLRRTLIVMGVYCAQTLSGNPLRSQSTYFLNKAGLPSTESFNMTIINYALAMVGGFCTFLVIPYFGRRAIFFWSLVAMFILMVIIGALGVPLSDSGHAPYAWAIGAILIVSSFLYNVASGSITNTICAELPSALLRSKSVVLARWVYSVTSIIAGCLTPYQLNTTAWNWGAKTGFFWAGGCLLSAIFAYFCVPESKDRTTAEIDILFERNISSRHFATTSVDIAEAIIEQDQDKKV